MDKKLALGFRDEYASKEAKQDQQELRRYLNMKLAANGLPISAAVGSQHLMELTSALLANFREKTRLLGSYRCPVDARIEAFLNDHFADCDLDGPLQVPGRALVLDRHGLARELSLPASGNQYSNDYMESFRVRNGVLHNPAADRRTTKGTFHVADGGLPVAGDKRIIPKKAFVEIFRHAVNPPNHVLQLPFTSDQENQAFCWSSILLRPLVQPEVPGYCQEKSYEVRFFAPGNLVANLDFVESIFGNAGDPYVAANDAGLDVEHWTGHTGCVILAPHLPKLTKKELGLPHISEATDRQKRDRMCWEDEGELYNDGGAFKATCRTDAGVIVTIIADSYFGYCKKEVKTQISYSANLMGNVEEEHAGGALVYHSWILGERFQMNSRRHNGNTFENVVRENGERIEVQPEGYGIDKNFSNLIYVPEDALANLIDQDVSWERNGTKHSIPLLPGHYYIGPSGYKFRMEKHPSAPSWRLIGIAGEGIFCHKPCTVSGGGKSEISKSLRDYMQYGPIFVSKYDQDMAMVEEIFTKDYSARWKPAVLQEQNYSKFPSRPVLSERRSLGSVIKLLTPSADYTDEYNQWVTSIPNHILAIAFIIKRFYREEWGEDWRSHFSVDMVNGDLGHELKIGHRKLVGTYLRVGFQSAAWRMFKLRQDFAAAFKVQTEDDISASTVVPSSAINPIEDEPPAAYKFVKNCEYRLFQRPDDAIHRGFDKQAEADLARRNANFISNFEPLTKDEVSDMLEKVVDFDAFTEPMQKLLRSVDKGKSEYIVCSDNPRRVGGVPTKNPRYLQDRPDVVNPLDKYMAEVGTRLFRKLAKDEPVHMPVSSILCGRRNNPPEPEKGIRSLAVYGPIHYQELPELFMDYVCALTGKSPSTTGAGSEGALTKGPFNCLRLAADLNAALVAMVLSGHAGFSTAAGFVGSNARFDHDLSLLAPEVWCRMSHDEREPDFLIAEGCLEKLNNYEVDGKTILQGRLGYRITRTFVSRFFARVFDDPNSVFDDSILKPELQDQNAYADGVNYITEAHERVAKQYFEDGSFEILCPPLRALVSIMAHGDFEGKTESDPEIREMFTYGAIVNSDWYQQRLEMKQSREIALWSRHVDYLNNYSLERLQDDVALKDTIVSRKKVAAEALERVRSAEYLESLIGTIGAQPTL